MKVSDLSVNNSDGRCHGGAIELRVEKVMGQRERPRLRGLD